MFQAFVGIGWLGVVLAAVFSFLFGMLWYGPLFGKTWMKLAGFKKEDLKMDNPGLTMGAAVVGSFLAALMLELLFLWAGVTIFHAAAVIAIAGFLGFSGPKMMDGVLWGKQSWGLFWFNATFTVLTYVGMAALLFYL